eukprot:g32749.t1
MQQKDRSIAAQENVLSHTPQVKQALSIRWAAACEQAGGQEVVLGAAAAGGTSGLCLGALLFSGESSAAAQQRLADAIQAAQLRNRTGVIRSKLRRGFRKRLLMLSAGSAAAAAYLCTLPTAMEGGSGFMAEASGIARRLGRSVGAFGHTMLQAPPSTRRKRRKCPKLKVTVILPSGRGEEVLVAGTAKVGDVKVAAQKSFGQGFLRLVAPDGRNLDLNEDLAKDQSLGLTGCGRVSGFTLDPRSSPPRAARRARRAWARRARCLERSWDDDASPRRSCDAADRAVGVWKLESLDSGVAVLTLNRPKALNALSDGLMKALFECLQEVDADAALKAVVVTGQGKAFAAGADIKEGLEPWPKDVL